MNEPSEEPRDDSDERNEQSDSLIPPADAGPTQAEKWSRDEDDHGRQDHGP